MIPLLLLLMMNSIFLFEQKYLTIHIRVSDENSCKLHPYDIFHISKVFLVSTISVYMTVVFLINTSIPVR